MAGLNGVAIKRAIHTRLVAAPALDGVRVDRHPDLSVELSEYVFFGEIEFEHSYPLSRGGGARHSRDETAYLFVYIEVSEYGGNIDAVEDRALEIGEVLEHTLAEDPNLGGLPGVIYGGVTSGDVFPETGIGNQVRVTLVYRLKFESRLT